MYSLILYQSISNPYMRLVRVADGFIVHATTYVPTVALAWGSSDIALAKDSVIGGIPVTISELLPAGEYDMLFYDNGTPADSDEVQIGKRIHWSGKQLIGLPMDV